MSTHSFHDAFQHRYFVPILAALMILLVVCGFAASRAQTPQREEREVEGRIPAHLPIKVKVKNPEKVKDLKNDGWLGDLEIEVKNTGDKPIYFLRLGLIFVDVRKDSGNEIGYSLVYGRGELINIENRPEEGDIPLPPGGTHVFKLNESYVKGWNWYRTKVEKKPHPKKVAIIFSTINFGDGTGFVGTDGGPIPEKSSRGEEKRNGWPKATSQSGLIRPPDPRFLQATFLLPAETSPANFFPAGIVKLSADFTPAQSCCGGGPSYFRLRLEVGGNCFCPPPPEDPEPSFHVVEDGFQCQGTGFSCRTARYEDSECGEGITYRTCTQVFLDPCGAPTPTPPPTPPPSPTPTPPPDGPPPNETNCYWDNYPGTEVWGWQCFCQEGTPADYQQYGPGGCPSGTYNDGDNCCKEYACPEPKLCDRSVSDWDPIRCCCVFRNTKECDSPVLIDVAGDGFALTDTAGGVRFDFDGDGVREKLSWTAAGSDDSWLALDRDGDGRIGSGRELFGNLTPQPSPPAGRQKNGFLALAEYDRPALGGNADGVIDARAAVFASLRLWRDANHDGVSQTAELYPLPALDVVRLHLDYKEAKREDAYGNGFRYRAKVDDAKGAKVGRWAWDVFLVPGR